MSQTKHETYNQLGLKQTKYRIQNTTYKYKYNYAVNKSWSVDWNSQRTMWISDRLSKKNN